MTSNIFDVTYIDKCVRALSTVNEKQMEKCEQSTSHIVSIDNNNIRLLQVYTYI